MLLALLRQYVQPYRWLIAAVVMLQIMSALAALYLPTMNASIIDDGITRGNTRLIAELGLIMLAITAVQALCALSALYCAARIALGISRDLRSALFHRIMTFAEREISMFSSSSLLTRSTHDVRQIQIMVQLTATVIVTAPIMGLGGIVMTLQQDAGLAWLLAISIPILAVANYGIVRQMLPIVRSMQQRIDTINRVVREQLSGIRVIRAFQQHHRERRRFTIIANEAFTTAVAAGRWQALMLPISTATINITSVALIWWGGLRIDSGQMDIGVLIAVLSYCLQILMAVLMATMVVALAPRASVCAQRITDVLETQPAITPPLVPHHPSGRIRGAITLRNVTVRHPCASSAVLNDISLHCNPGTTTAIIGSTGSGKSTLLATICRLYEVSSGSVQLDNIDIRNYALQSLWSTISFVPQQGYLFSGTVADNLYNSSTEISDEHMWTALRIAAIDDVIQAHPDGLAMRIAQGGLNFSGGQRQRLAIARAVLAAPAVYLFDDTFCALDTPTEVRILTALRKISTQATIIMVSQRISTVMNADHIIVLDNGHIVGTGTHHTLSRQCRTYAQFVESQSANIVIGEHQ